MATKKEAKKVIDVSHPGDAEPSATSKPVIVTNRPILKDPMMVAENSDDQAVVPQNEDPSIQNDSEEHKVEVKKAGGIKLSTLEEAARAKEEGLTADVSSAEKPSTEDSDKSEAEPVEMKSSMMDEASDDKIKDPEDEEKKEAEAGKREAELQKLIDSKTYYLPINTVEKRRTHRTVVFGLSLSVLLGLAWLNVALDAGLISLGGLQAVTDFF